jgi:hypothetical protein
VGRRVSCYGPIVLRRVVVRVAVALVDGRADGRQLLGPGGGGRGVVWMGGVGMGVVVVLLVRQGDGVGGMMWLWSACAKSVWCLRRRLGLVVSCLPLGPCHHSFARVAVHGRATSTAKPQRGRASSIIGGATQRHGLEVRAAASVHGEGGLLGGCVSCAQAPVGGAGAATDAADGGDEVGRMGNTNELGEDGGLVWRLLDHTEPLSVSLACGSSLTKPEPDPSCVKIHAPQYEHQ